MKYFLAEHPRGQTIPYDSFRNFQTYFDWSRVAVRLVMSIPGNYQDSSADREFTNMSKYGICRLGKVLHEEGWKPQKGERVVAEYQVSCLPLNTWLIDRTRPVVSTTPHGSTCSTA